MFCVAVLVSTASASLVMPADDTNLRIEDISEAMDVIDPVRASITELSYVVMLGIIGLASTGLVASTLASDNSIFCSIEIPKVINRTEHVFSSTTEVMDERYVENGGAPSNKS